MTTNPMPLSTALRTLADLIDTDDITDSSIEDMIETMLDESEDDTDPRLADFARFANSLLNFD